MNLQVLVSTMHQKDYNLIRNMNIGSDAIIINQCDNEGKETLNAALHNIKWIDTKTRGLSVSRNLAIEYADADICLLADDDLVYINNYKEKIINQFEKYKSVDIIVFQVEGIERKFKRYSKNEKKVGYLQSMKVSSVEIAFRTQKIKENNIKFNELFGSGSKYSMGEENLFLTECIRKKIKIMYLPIKIANLHMNKSSWFTGYNEKYFIDRGAGYEAMSKLLCIPMILQFALRKYSLYCNKFSVFKVIKLMLEGRNQLRKINSQN